MIGRATVRTARCLACWLLLVWAGSAQAGSDFVSDPTWRPADRQAVYNLLVDYLSAAKVSPDRQAEIRDLWWAAGGSEDEAGELLDQLAECLAQTDDRVAELVAYCSTSGHPLRPKEFAWLADSETPALVSHNMRLYYGRWLTQAGYYDEALAWTDGLKTADVVAPELLLFYRAVAYHQLVQPDQANATVLRLLERPDDLADRHHKLALLMQQDLTGLEDESLDYIARRMADIRRRLAQGSADHRVQDVEKGVVESLDKLIKNLEEQMQQMQCSSPAGGQPSGTPMQDSQIAELKGPGRVEHRDVGDSADWGNLPAKDREQALQEIGREFPSHYREIIEEYFRRLASDESTDNP